MKRILATSCLLFLLGSFAQTAAAQSWTPNGPLPRAAHSAVLDLSTNRMIVFGGFSSDTTSSPPFLNDAWLLLAPTTALGGSSRNWSQVHATGTPPAPRFGHSAGYDPGSNRMIVFAGAEGSRTQCGNDVWALTNANGTGGTSTWTQLNPAGTLPGYRAYQGSVYDPTSNTLIIYGGDGGNDCNTTIGDLWVLSDANGVSGTPTWTQFTPSGGPGPRELPGVVYDSTSNELILFGGANGNIGETFNDVWVLTNANGSGGIPAWTQLSPAGTLPPARDQAAATYDPTTNRMTIFGGESSSGLLGDTWVLTHANGLGGTPAWSQIAAASQYFPAPREHHTGVYNLVTNQMTIFGGLLVYEGNLETNDVFILSDANGE